MLTSLKNNQVNQNRMPGLQLISVQMFSRQVIPMMLCGQVEIKASHKNNIGKIPGPAGLQIYPGDSNNNISNTVEVALLNDSSCSMQQALSISHNTAIR